MKIEIGTKVVGNWGAMHGTSEGEIVGIEMPSPNRLLPDNGRGIEILWEGETEVDFCHENSIHEKGWRSVNGSGIGIFIK